MFWHLVVVEKHFGSSCQFEYFCAQFCKRESMKIILGPSQKIAKTMKASSCCYSSTNVLQHSVNWKLEKRRVTSNMSATFGCFGFLWYLSRKKNAKNYNGGANTKQKWLSRHTCTHTHTHTYWMTEHCIYTGTFPLKGWQKSFPPLGCFVPPQWYDTVWSWLMSLSVLFIKRLGSSSGYLNHCARLASAFLC